jgi:hypothetical protein
LGKKERESEHWRVTQEQPKLSLKQRRLIMDYGDYFLELCRLVVEL